MTKALFALGALLLSPGFVSNLPGQSVTPSAPRSISNCASDLRGGGLDCALNRRMLIVVTLNGSEPSGALLNVIAMAAPSAGVFALTPQNATASDSAFYAVINVRRDPDGNYRIDRSIAGSAVKDPDNCRGYSTGIQDDMGFGASLALETQSLVRCVQNARGMGMDTALRPAPSQPPSAPMNNIPVTLSSGTVIHVRNVVVLRNQGESALTLYIETPTPASDRQRIAAEAKEALNFQLRSAAGQRFSMANVVVCRTQACLAMVERSPEMFLFGRAPDGTWQAMDLPDSH